MTADPVPGGRLALTLLSLGGSAVFVAGLVFALHSGSAPASGLALAAIWGLVALGVAMALRKPPAANLKPFAILWLTIALAAWAWLWWSQNV